MTPTALSALQSAAQHIEALRNEMAAIKLRHLPCTPITLSDLAKLPNISCVYFLVQNKSIMYVGQSGNLRNRVFNCHYQMERAIEEGGMKIFWMECPKGFLLTLETILISLHQPRWNIRSLVSTDDFIFTEPHRLSEDQISEILASDPRPLGPCYSLRFPPNMFHIEHLDEKGELIPI